MIIIMTLRKIITDNNLVLLLCDDKTVKYTWKNLTRDEVNQKYRKYYNNKCNIAIACGFFDDDDTGILGFDIDNIDEYNNWIQTNNISKQEIENTYGEITPTGSIHFYYKINDNLRNLTIGENFPCKGVDYRGKHGYMICVGSKFSAEMCKKHDKHRCSALDDSSCEYDGKKYKKYNNIDYISVIPKSLENIFFKKIKTDNKILQTEHIKKEKEREIKSLSYGKFNYIDNSLVSISLDCIDSYKVEERNKWLTLASVLKSLNYGFNEYHKISSNSINHDPCTCQEVFDSANLYTGPCPIWKICKMAISHNINKYKKLNPLLISDIELIILKKFVYPSIEFLTTFIENICLGIIHIICNGAEKIVAIKRKVSDNDTSYNYSLCKYKQFIENYGKHKLKYVESYDEPKKFNNITFAEILNSNPKFHYHGTKMIPYYTFDTQFDNSKWLNIFSPMIAQKIDTYNLSIIQPILDHIKIVWANNDELLYKYILSYFHNMLKNPSERLQIAMVILGQMGCGKSIICEYMLKHIFGEYCGVKTQGMKRLLSKFQGILENKIMVIIEEPTQLKQENLSEYTEAMKDFITTLKLIIEKKCVDQYQIDVYHNIIITCNDLKGINVSNHDRRYFIIECSEKFLNNFEYFENLTKILDDKYNMDAFFSYLYDYSDTVPLRPIPLTHAKKNAADERMEHIEQFLFGEYKFDSDKLLQYNNTFNNVHDIYSCYRQWYFDMGKDTKFIFSKDKFYKNMHKYGKTSQKRLNKDEQIKIKNKFKLDTVSDRHYCFVFSDDTINKLLPKNDEELSPDNYEKLSNQT